MVCVPCIVIPLVLWIFHKFIQPFVIKFWNPWGKKSVTEGTATGPPQGVTEDDKEYQFIHQKIKEHPVMIFSKTTCSYCKMAKDLLDKLQVDYTVEQIDHREDCEALQVMFSKMTGQRTVPRVFIGGKCVGGGSETWSLHNQNKLVPMLKESGATFRDKKSD